MYSRELAKKLQEAAKQNKLHVISSIEGDGWILNERHNKDELYSHHDKSLVIEFAKSVQNKNNLDIVVHKTDGNVDYKLPAAG